MERGGEITGLDTNIGSDFRGTVGGVSRPTTEVVLDKQVFLSQALSSSNAIIGPLIGGETQLKPGDLMVSRKTNARFIATNKTS